MQAKTTLERIPLDRIVASQWNPRKIKPDSPGIPELAASLKDGQIAPIVCRPLPDADPEREVFEIVDGERRWVAAQVAGMPDILATIRHMTETDAQAAVTKANLERLDFTPLEEARAVAALRKGGLSIREVAERLGKSDKWVSRRDAIALLHPDWLKAAKDERLNVKDWSLEALGVIASLPEDTQQKLLANSTKKRPDYNRPLLGNIRAGELVPRASEVWKRIGRDIDHKLADAPWKLEDTDLLPKAGACSACPHRSSRSLCLFDLHENGGVDADDRCLKPDCYKKKAAAHTTRTIEQQAARHPGRVVVAVPSYLGKSERPALPSGVGKIERVDYNAQKASAKDPNATLVVELDHYGMPRKPRWVVNPTKAKKKAKNSHDELAPKRRQEAREKKRLTLIADELADLVSLGGEAAQH